MAQPDRRPLRVLHLEDEPHDAELVAARLRADGVECEIVAVDSRAEFEAALRTPCDVILADDRLPSFDGAAALAIARERAPETPFLFVSGTLGEEVAVERLKAGATDYVLKQRLSRLASAISRALAESEVRKRRQDAEAEVRRLNAELEARVEARTAELEAANQALGEREGALRISEARLQAILDHTPSIVSLKDLDGTYLLVNRAFERTYGVSRSQVTGLRDADFFAPRLAEIYAANDAHAIRSGMLQAEEPAIYGGSVRVHEASRFPLIGLDGKPYAVCCIADDITDRKRGENEIKMARLEAERANRAKSDFLSRMSHDLRTPLNAVLGFAQLLSAERLTDGQRECVQQISHGGRHLLDLVNEVLDIARIEAGHLSLSPEPVRVSDSIRYVVDLVAPLVSDRGLTLVVDASSFADQAVMADRQRLNQVLLNLLSNAVKYNRPRGRVTLSCLCPSPGRLRIVVTDTGAGIPEQKLQLLFRPFERLGAERTGIEGTGLGLTLARGLVEAMGGSVGVESVVDRGSSFWIELAIAKLESVASPVRTDPVLTPEASSLPPGLVLYVEDNVSNLRLMERLLQSRPSITLLHALDGETGLRLTRERRPDLVLLDLHLPDLPGEEVLRQLWADPDLRRIPVAVLSADATPGQMRRVLASGASAYLTKPLDLKHVLEVIERLLGPGRAEPADPTFEVSE